MLEYFKYWFIDVLFGMMFKFKWKEKFVFFKYIFGEIDGESGKDKSRKKDMNEILFDSVEIVDGGG